MRDCRDHRDAARWRNAYNIAPQEVVYEEELAGYCKRPDHVPDAEVKSVGLVDAKIGE